MSIDREFPIVMWSVCCFDRRRKNPLPVYTRWHCLDWARLTPPQIAEVLAIIDAEAKQDSPHAPAGFDESIITMSIGRTAASSQLTKYRQFFEEIPNNDLKGFFEHPGRRNRGFHNVRISGEYFEDETGTPVSRHAMMQHVTGQQFPVIVGDPESVIKIGPVSPKNGDSWTIEKSNTVAQFLDVVQRLRTSKWYRSRHSITSLSLKKTGDNKLLEAEFPDDEDTMSVLAYFRQLHRGDKLLTKACEVYIAHVSDDRKRWWMDERKQAFESLVDSPPFPYNTNGKSRRQIIQMFMYGARLLHSSSAHGDDVAFGQFIAQHGTHQAVMIFNSCLMDFLRVAATICPVVRQDYDHWVSKEGFSAADRVAIPNLFKGFTSPPHGR